MQTQGLIPAILPGHIVTWATALVLGYLAVYAAKVTTLHRMSAKPETVIAPGGANQRA